MASRSNLEEFFLTLLWGMDTLLNPSLSTVGQSFEAWERRLGGSTRRWERLEKRKLVARDSRTKELVYQLTDAGRAAAMGGANLSAAWNLPWDGKWRVIFFDLPERDRKLRVQLWRWLRANHFGYLQGSVWVRPDPINQVEAVLTEFREDVEALTIMEAQCTRPNENEAIVQGAWDIEEINKRFQAYIKSYTLQPGQAARLRASQTALNQWLRTEKVAWRHAMRLDPLLPRELLPAGYLGEAAWKVRRTSFALIAGLRRS